MLENMKFMIRFNIFNSKAQSYLKPQSQLSVPLWWSCMCYGVCQSWLIVALKNCVEVIESAMQEKRTFGVLFVGVPYNFLWRRIIFENTCCSSLSNIHNVTQTIKRFDQICIFLKIPSLFLSK